MFGRSALLAVLAAALAASPLSAQETYLGAAVFGGAFFPTTDLVADDLSQTTGFAFGGRLSVWALRRFGVELEGVYAISDVDSYLGKQSGWAGAFSMNLVYSILKPPLEPLDIYLSGGLGLIKRGSDFFEEEDELQELTDVAGVIGTGIRYGVRRNLYIRVDVKDYISSFTKPYEDSELQNDLLVTAGIEVRTKIGSQ